MMVLEIKSISCIESLKKIPEIFELQNESNWLNIVQYSLSTRAGTLVFAYETKIIVLSNKWDSRTRQSKYSITWSDELERFDDITAVLCLPIDADADENLTGILVGFSTGKCQLMTNRGKVIISQQWLPEPVQSIQIPNGKKAIDEIYVVYQSSVCILQTKQLMQSIRNFEKLDRTNELIGSVSCRIWKYGESYSSVDNVTDCAIIGTKKIGLFDHLLAASMEGGFYAKYRSAAPQQLSMLTVGIKPFAGFYYAREMTTLPLVSVAIAQAVASTVKNVLPSWLTGVQKTQENAEPTPTISNESTILRYGYYDDHRSGCRVWLSPLNHLAVVADALGRIILFDCVQDVILRIWKGYRDAQCSFMKVDEKLSRSSSNAKRRHVLFLAIYAPKRSTVDIWNVERGKKLASLPVGPSGQLIQQHSTMGNLSMSSSSSSSSRAASNVTQKATSVTAFFLNPNELTIKELTIPFHHALDVANTVKSKDLHIINQIKADLKAVHEENIAEIGELCESIQLNEMKMKCIQAIIKSRHITPEIFEVVLTTFAKSCQDEGGEQTSEDDDIPTTSPSDTKRGDPFSRKKLIGFLRRYDRLLQFYNGMKQKPSQNDSDSDDIEIGESNFQEILNAIDRYKMCLNLKKTTKVSIQSPVQNTSFIEYLSIFDCSSSDGIRLHESKSNRFANVGFELFDTFIRNHSNFDSFYKHANVSTLKNWDLLRLFLKYWMEKDIRYSDKHEIIKHLNSFLQIVQIICDLDRSCAEHHYGSFSPWWQRLRELLLEESSVFKSLLAAILCRDLSVLYRQIENHESTGEDDMWEQVSQETAQWSLLIGKLDDIAALSSILSFHPVRPKIPLDDVVILDYFIPDISLMTILNGGNGIVADLVAKWIASTGIKPSAFFHPAEQEEATEHFTPNTAISYLDVLRTHFPFSLQSGVLLCHLTWEYAHAWSKHPHQFEYLSVSVGFLSLFDAPDQALKHGICCLIWNSILRKYIQLSMKLVNSGGKGVEELREQTKFTNVMIPDFMNQCLHYLNHMIDSLNSSPVTVKTEEIFPDGASLSLAAKASQEPKAKCELLDLHFQLLEVLLIVATHNVKVKGPIASLFIEVSRGYLACDINEEVNEPLRRSDDTVDKARKQFLHRTINGAVELIRKDFQDVFLDEFNLWTDKVMVLGDKWSLDSNELLKYQVIQLFTCGWDECAEAKLKQVVQPSTMGRMFLSITATRLNKYTKNDPELYSRVLAIGTRISGFLETLDGSSLKLPRQADSEEDDGVFVENLLRLAKITFECLSKQESTDLKLAAQLYDACIEVKDYLKSTHTSH